MTDKESQHWQLLFQQSPLGAIEWNLDWRVMSWNPAAERIFGWSAAEAMGQFWKFIVPESEIGRVAGVTRALSQQDGGTRSSNLNITKCGKVIRCEWFNTTLVDRNGRTVGAASLVQDVTEQIESQQRLVGYTHRLSDINNQLRKLALNNSFHRETLDATLKEITEVAAQALSVSRVSAWLFDWAVGEARCARSFDRVSGEHTSGEILPFARYPRFFQALFEERLVASRNARFDPRTVEFTNDYFLPHDVWSKLVIGTRLRGELVGMICFEQKASPRDWAPEEQIFAAAIGDLVSLALESRERQKAETAQRRLEAELFQKHKLEALGTLAGGIAHDFNNILAVILGSTELALIRANDKIPPLDELQRISAAAHRARDLVNQILLFSKSQPIERHPLRLQDVIYDSLKLIRATFPSSIQVIERLNAPAAIVDSHATFIYQILLNLCSNAVHACDGNSGIVEITLEHANIDLGAHQAPQPGVALTIRDSGCGIDAKIREHIFDPFFTTKDPGKGTGLGLAVVHSIVDGMGGRIRVETSLGKGTAFRVEIPLSSGAPSQSPLAKGIIPGKGERILLIDDEIEVLNSTARLLEHLGYVVVAFSDPRRALAEYEMRGPSFALIISDITMPYLNGALLAREISHRDPDAKFLFMSGFGFDIDRARLPSDRVLQKPVDLATLARAVRHALDQDR